MSLNDSFKKGKSISIFLRKQKIMDMNECICWSQTENINTDIRQNARSEDLV